MSVTQLNAYRSEQVTIFTEILNKLEKIDVADISTPQDGMLRLRIIWETIQTKLRDRKVEGFEPVVQSMVDLAAMTMAVAADLQAKLRNFNLAVNTYTPRVLDELKEEQRLEDDEAVDSDKTSEVKVKTVISKKLNKPVISLNRPTPKVAGKKRGRKKKIKI